MGLLASGGLSNLSLHIVLASIHFGFMAGLEIWGAGPLSRLRCSFLGSSPLYPIRPRFRTRPIEILSYPFVPISTIRPSSARTRPLLPFFFTTFVYQPLFCIRLSPSPSIVAGLRFPHASFGSTGNCRYPRLKRPHHPIRVLSLPPPIIPSPPLVPSPCAAWPGIGGYGDSGDSSVVLWVVSLLSVSAHRLDRFGSVDCRAREV